MPVTLPLKVRSLVRYNLIPQEYLRLIIMQTILLQSKNVWWVDPGWAAKLPPNRLLTPPPCPATSWSGEKRKRTGAKNLLGRDKDRDMVCQLLSGANQT